MKVLKFGAIWCSGCLIMKPRWQEIEKELPGLKTQYIEYEAKHPLVIKYGIDKQLPVFVFLNNNEKELIRLEGEVSKQRILKAIRENITQ